jgi:hypothetical protein
VKSKKIKRLYSNVRISFQESADLSFVKKTLVLAERFELPILKMVSFGVIVDRLLNTTVDDHYPVPEGRGVSKSFSMGSSNSTASSPSYRSSSFLSSSSSSSGGDQQVNVPMTVAESMDEIREELMQIAEQITT